MPLDLPPIFAQRKIYIKIGNYIDGNWKVRGQKIQKCRGYIRCPRKVKYYKKSLRNIIEAKPGILKTSRSYQKLEKILRFYLKRGKLIILNMWF